MVQDLGSVVQQVCELNIERVSAKFSILCARRLLLKTAINIEKCLLRMFTFRGSDILLFIFGIFFGIAYHHAFATKPNTN